MLVFSSSRSMLLFALLFVSISGNSTSVKSTELYFGCSVLTYWYLSFWNYKSAIIAVGLGRGCGSGWVGLVERYGIWTHRWAKIGMVEYFAIVINHEWITVDAKLQMREEYSCQNWSIKKCNKIHWPCTAESFWWSLRWAHQCRRHPVNWPREPNDCVDRIPASKRWSPDVFGYHSWGPCCHCGRQQKLDSNELDDPLDIEPLDVPLPAHIRRPVFSHLPAYWFARNNLCSSMQLNAYSRDCPNHRQWDTWKCEPVDVANCSA